jgi:hypothetical protein
MSNLRLISTIRSLLLTTKCSRILLSFRTLASIDLHPCIPMRTQQICLFSSSTILQARRRDQIEAVVAEELDDEEEDEDEEDKDSDQVI